LEKVGRQTWPRDMSKNYKGPGGQRGYKANSQSEEKKGVTCGVIRKIGRDPFDATESGRQGEYSKEPQWGGKKNRKKATGVGIRRP